MLAGDNYPRKIPKENDEERQRIYEEKGELDYVETDVQDIQILLIEWTHGGSECLAGVDLPIYIDSIPEETLQRRVKRNRDGNEASELIQMVIGIEQSKLQKQAKCAKIVVGRDGGIYEHD